MLQHPSQQEEELSPWKNRYLDTNMCYEIPSRRQPEIITSLLNNSASWIGLNDEIIDTLQDFQNKFMLRFFEAPKQGTPTGIVELDSNMLLMKNRIMLSKLTYVGKIMAKSTSQNMCKRALQTEKKSAKERTY